MYLIPLNNVLLVSSKLLDRQRWETAVKKQGEASRLVTFQLFSNRSYTPMSAVSALAAKLAILWNDQWWKWDLFPSLNYGSEDFVKKKKKHFVIGCWCIVGGGDLRLVRDLNFQPSSGTISACKFSNSQKTPWDWLINGKIFVPWSNLFKELSKHKTIKLICLWD